jgi:hypothetical protein
MTYNCDRCKKEFKQLNLLLRHLNSKTVCKIAQNGQDISQSDLITKYTNIQKDIKNNILSCPNCNKKFEKLRQKYSHLEKCKSTTSPVQPTITTAIETINATATDNATTTVNVLTHGDINNHIINNYYAEKQSGFITPQILAEFSEELCKMRKIIDLYIFLIEKKWYRNIDESTWLIKNTNIKIEIPFKIYNGIAWVNTVKRTEISDICRMLTEFCDRILALISTNLTIHNVRKVYNRYKFYINHFCKYRSICQICTEYYMHKAPNYADDECIGKDCIKCQSYTKHKCINDRVECVYCTKKENYRINYDRLCLHVVVACLLELDDMGIRADPSKSNAELYSLINNIFRDYTEKKYTFDQHIQLKGQSDYDNLSVDVFLKWYNENIDRLLNVSELSPKTLLRGLI